MNIHSALLLLAVITFASGCAFTKTTVVVNFKAPTFTDTAQSETKVSVKKLADARGVDRYLLANKGVGTRTSGAYITTNEVAEIVTGALRDTLVALKYKLSADGADVTLTGDILKFDSTPLMGFWSGQLEGSIQLNLKLLDARTGTVLWSEIVSGVFKKSGLQLDHEGHRKEVAEGTLQDAMKQLAASPSLKAALQNHRAR